MRLINGLLHAVCIICAVLGMIGLAVYIAAAIAIVKAGEIMGGEDE